MSDSSKRSASRSGAYAKVYDGFPSHAKVIGIPREIRAEAVGTWTLCMSWSNQHLTDGYIPAAIVTELAGTERGAAALVATRLWRTRNGGYVFVNWDGANSTREEVEAKRRANADRQKRYRDRHGKTRDGGTPVTRNESRGDAQSESKTETETETETDDLRSSAIDDEMTGSPVDKSAVNIERVQAALAKAVGGEVTRAGALYVIGQLTERRGRDAKPLTNPTAWAVRAIGNDWPECSKWLHEVGGIKA